MKELALWLVGVLLAFYGLALLVGSPFFWGLVMLSVGTYFIYEASKLADSSRSKGGK